MWVVDREQKEYAVFHELLHMIPGLEAWLMGSLEEQVVNIADLVTSPTICLHPLIDILW